MGVDKHMICFESILMPEWESWNSNKNVSRYSCCKLRGLVDENSSTNEVSMASLIFWISKKEPFGQPFPPRLTQKVFIQETKPWRASPDDSCRDPQPNMVPTRDQIFRDYLSVFEWICHNFEMNYLWLFAWIPNQLYTWMRLPTQRNIFLKSWPGGMCVRDPPPIP